MRCHEEPHGHLGSMVKTKNTLLVHHMEGQGDAVRLMRLELILLCGTAPLT